MISNTFVWIGCGLARNAIIDFEAYNRVLLVDAYPEFLEHYERNSSYKKIEYFNTLISIESKQELFFITEPLIFSSTSEIGKIDSDFESIRIKKTIELKSKNIIDFLDENLHENEIFDVFIDLNHSSAPITKSLASSKLSSNISKLYVSAPNKSESSIEYDIFSIATKLENLGFFIQDRFNESHYFPTYVFTMHPAFKVKFHSRVNELEEQILTLEKRFHSCEKEKLSEDTISAYELKLERKKYEVENLQNKLHLALKKEKMLAELLLAIQEKVN